MESHSHSSSGQPRDPQSPGPQAPGDPEGSGAHQAPGTGQAQDEGGSSDPAQGARPWPTLGQQASYDEPPPGFHPPYGDAPPYGGYQEHDQGSGGVGGGRVPAARRPRRLYRSERDRLIAGVCGGLRDFTGIDANLLRVGFVLLALFGSGFGLLLYVVAWALIPRESRLGLSPTDTVLDAVDEVRDRFQRIRRA